MVSWRAALACCLVACAQDEPLTQLVLVADTDLQLDAISFEAKGMGGYTRSATATRERGGPSYVTLLRDEGPLANVTITASGLLNGKVVVTREQVVSFVPDQTRVVELDLYASCVGVTCKGDSTCAAGRCQDRTLAAEQLPDWDGAPHSPFAAPDAGVSSDASVAEDGGWLRQCDAPMLVDTSKDAMNCGACGKKCKPMERCQLGMCGNP